MSDDCKDLLSKVLVGRPSKRYTIQEIQKHPWYLKDLPPGVIQMNNECLKLRNYSSGFQTNDEIQSIVMQAIGTTQIEEDNDDDIIVSFWLQNVPKLWLCETFQALPGVILIPFKAVFVCFDSTEQQ